ncbi:unnamed protein product [Bursaphelenchus xylophilus]|uniref:(pine wood nematode) hypothetical protein n=1 Tax=Bursaphelenchus xylophilus TaxID=6326 RepID=A0A7I8XLW4_BURXY|nr:unnamed protein product [Bursaphelenchus xylophilus]CAG9086734.1 unnamed protein product [Bursaphelenchus xylophilus]
MRWTVITSIVLHLQFVKALKCFYCQQPSQRIAPQLWLHSTEQCTRRRVTECEGNTKACVVVAVRNSHANFTVSGCSEDEFVGCEEYDVQAEYGRTNVQVCQCNSDRCNSDFHLDFGKDFNRLKSGATQRTLPKFLGLEEDTKYGNGNDGEGQGKSRQDREQISLQYQEISTPASHRCDSNAICGNSSMRGSDFPPNFSHF